MPALQVSQPLVAAVLGVVVLDETVYTGRAGIVALTTAVLVMAVAIVRLATVEAVTTGNRVEANVRNPVSLPA
jgi:hypothetical protein